MFRRKKQVNIPADPDNEISVLLAANYPLICAVTTEEQRVIDVVAEFSEQNKYQVFLWSLARGVHDLKGNLVPGSSRAGENTPSKLMNFIERYDKDAVFILLDYHHILKDPECVRGLKDTVLRVNDMPYAIDLNLGGSRRPIVMTMPVMSIPEDLQSLTTVVHVPLPKPEEFIELLVDRKEQQIPSEELEQIASAAKGLTLMEAYNVFVKSKRLTGRIDPKVVKSEKEQVIRKSGLLEYIEPEVNFDNIGGLQNLKTWVRRRKQAYSAHARSFGLEPPRGLVITGIQGCGKSLACKAIASELGMPLLKVDVGALFSKWVGESEANVRKMLQVAESVAPCVLWLDEIDKSLSSGQGGDSGTSTRVIATILNWMQERREPVFVVATANDISVLRPETIRKGRFDEIFFVDLPSPEERKEILAIHLRKRGRNPGSYDLDQVVEVTDGWSGAELEELVKEALYLAYDEQARDVETEHLMRCTTETRPLSVTMSEKLEEIRRWAKERARPAH